MSDVDECHQLTGNNNDSIGLRVGSVFIILATSLLASFFPVITKRVPRCRVPDRVFDVCRYFGSGVILATAFMHLIEPASDELSSPCLSETFQDYPFAFLFALFSALCTFFFEMMAFRLGAKLATSLAYDPHGSHQNEHKQHLDPCSHDDEPTPSSASSSSPEREEITLNKAGDLEWSGANSSSTKVSSHDFASDDGSVGAGASQILGCFILESGILLHSFIIGLTLGSTGDKNDFKVLFIVIIFHQMFEGLGLGVRLAQLPLDPKSWIPWIGAAAYPCVTPMGVAIGIGVRNSYNGNGAIANYVEGTLDAVSGGILAYAGFVELLAHDFIFNDKMQKAPMWELCFNIFCLFLGAGLMSLLAKWA